MKNRWIERITIGACLLAMGGGVWLRFARLGDQIYHNDEAWTGLWLSGHGVKGMQSGLCGRIIEPAELQRYLRLTPGRGFAATVSSVASDDPKQGPVYYGLLRLWVNLAGDSGGVRRTMSVLFGLLLCPLVFLLTRELFDSPLAGWIAAALISVSPAQILYSQDIRPYSMFAAIVLVSNWALARARRRQNPAGWRIYCATVIAGLYIHPLFILVIGTHAAYMILPDLVRGGLRSAWRATPTRAFVRTALVAGLAFSPWIVVFAYGWRRGLGGMAWMLNPIPFRYLAESWVSACGRLFVDITELAWPGILLYSMITCLVILSFVKLWRTQAWWSAGLPILSFLVPFLILIPADLLLGGQSSTIDRYFIAAHLGAQVGVAYLLATAIGSRNTLACGLGIILLGGLLASGAYSAWLNSRTEAPWIKGPARDHRRMAAVVNGEAHTLMVSDCGSIIRLLAFSPFLAGHVRVAPLRRSDDLVKKLDEDGLHQFQQILLFRGPVGSEFDGRFPVKPVPRTNQLWRLQRGTAE